MLTGVYQAGTTCDSNIQTQQLDVNFRIWKGNSMELGSGVCGIPRHSQTANHGFNPTLPQPVHCSGQQQASQRLCCSSELKNTWTCLVGG